MVRIRRIDDGVALKSVSSRRHTALYRVANLVLRWLALLCRRRVVARRLTSDPGRGPTH